MCVLFIIIYYYLLLLLLGRLRPIAYSDVGPWRSRKCGYGRLLIQLLIIVCARSGQTAVTLLFIHYGCASFPKSQVDIWRAIRTKIEVVGPMIVNKRFKRRVAEIPCVAWAVTLGFYAHDTMHAAVKTRVGGVCGCRPIACIVEWRTFINSISMCYVIILRPTQYLRCKIVNTA